MIVEDTYLVTVETASGERDVMSFCVIIPHKYYTDAEFIEILTQKAQEFLMNDEHCRKYNNYKITNFVSITRNKPVKEN